MKAKTLVAIVVGAVAGILLVCGGGSTIVYLLVSRGTKTVRTSPVVSAQESGISQAEREAVIAVIFAEVRKRLHEGPDGWTGGATQPNSDAIVLFQFREFEVRVVEKDSLTAADKLNGVEWAGDVGFKATPYRRYEAGAWSAWFTAEPEPMHAVLEHSEWRFDALRSRVEPTALVGGWSYHTKLPTAEQLTAAGVK